MDKCKNWKISKKGFISHSSGFFYKVEGVRILKSFNREAKGGWDQPMLTEPGYDGGILGLLKSKINNTPHYLINAKFEPVSIFSKASLGHSFIILTFLNLCSVVKYFLGSIIVTTKLKFFNKSIKY